VQYFYIILIIIIIIDLINVKNYIEELQIRPIITYEEVTVKQYVPGSKFISEFAVCRQ